MSAENGFTPHDLPTNISSEDYRLGEITFGRGHEYSPSQAEMVQYQDSDPTGIKETIQSIPGRMREVGQAVLVLGRAMVDPNVPRKVRLHTATGLYVVAAPFLNTDAFLPKHDQTPNQDSGHHVMLDRMPNYGIVEGGLQRPDIDGDGGPEPDDDPTLPPPNATTAPSAKTQTPPVYRVHLPLIVQGVPSGIDHGATVVASPTASETPEPSATTTPTLEPPTITPSPEPSATSSPSPSPEPTSTARPQRPEIGDELDQAYRVKVLNNGKTTYMSGGGVYDNQQYKGNQPDYITVAGSAQLIVDAAQGFAMGVDAIAMSDDLPPNYVNDETGVAPAIELTSLDGKQANANAIGITSVTFDNVTADGDNEQRWEVNGEACVTDDGELLTNPDGQVTTASRNALVNGKVVIEHFVSVDDPLTGDECEVVEVFSAPPADSSPNISIVRLKLPPHNGGWGIEWAELLRQSSYEPQTSGAPYFEDSNRPHISIGEGVIERRQYKAGTGDLLWQDPDALDMIGRGIVSGIVVDRGDIRFLDVAGIKPKAYENLYAAVLEEINEQRIARGQAPLSIMTHSWISGEGPSEMRRLLYVSPRTPEVQSTMRSVTRMGLDELFDTFGHIPGFSPVVINDVAYDNAEYDGRIASPWSAAFGEGARYKSLHTDIGGRAKKLGNGRFYVAEKGTLWSHHEYDYPLGNVSIRRWKKLDSMRKNFADARAAGGSMVGNMLIESGLPSAHNVPDWEQILRGELQRNQDGQPNMLVLTNAAGSNQSVQLELGRLHEITSEYKAQLAIPGATSSQSAIDILLELAKSR